MFPRAKSFEGFDWWLLVSVLPLLFFGLITMKSFGGDATHGDIYFWRQLAWIGAGSVAFVIFAVVDWRAYIKNSFWLLVVYGVGVAFLAALLIMGRVVRGVQSWYQVSSFSIQPAEFVKIALILILAKYFARRHIEIGLWRHIIVSGIYAGIPFLLVFLQPDVGTAFVFGAIWTGMVLFSGVGMRQLGILVLLGAVLVGFAWFFVFDPYQKVRIQSFLAPASDPRGSGYHANQARIAVGSGLIFGKGVGHGTQSRLNFLPESQNDFIFAAFVEEWGLVGALIALGCFGTFFYRLYRIAMRADGNEAQLVVFGIAVLVLAQLVIHVGMNTAILPVTGLSLPFMSYGGSLMLTLLGALGIVESIALRGTMFRRDRGEEVDLVAG